MSIEILRQKENVETETAMVRLSHYRLIKLLKYQTTLISNRAMFTVSVCLLLLH